MIVTCKQLVDRYLNKFFKTQGDENCVGVTWAKSIRHDYPEISCEEVFNLIYKKITDGSADHGWVILMLKLLWEDLSEQQRLILLNILKQGGAHKLFLSSKFTHRLTDSERGLLND